AAVSLSFVPVIHKFGGVAVLVPGACELTPPEEARDCGGGHPSYVPKRQVAVSRRANSTDLPKGGSVVCSCYG
ncbi:MAG: hypothetical protein ABIP19_05100, partial [Dermatophilaceae bacterium]